jgi:hypothetical protein
VVTDLRFDFTRHIQELLGMTGELQLEGLVKVHASTLERVLRM